MRLVDRRSFFTYANFSCVKKTLLQKKLFSVQLLSLTITSQWKKNLKTTVVSEMRLTQNKKCSIQVLSPIFFKDLLSDPGIHISKFFCSEVGAKKIKKNCMWKTGEIFLHTFKKEVVRVFSNSMSFLIKMIDVLVKLDTWHKGYS